MRSVAVSIFVAAAAFVPCRAYATTVCGTIITNMVSATMHSGPPDFVEYPTPGTAAPTFTAVVLVACPPAIHMQKFVNWPTASAGTTVTFRICIINETSDSVWGITVTDVLPSGMLAIDIDETWNDGDGGTPDLPPSPYDYGNTYGSFQTPPDVGGATDPVIAWDTSEVPNMGNTYPGSRITPGTGVPLYLRWTIEYVGPMRSACITYRAEVL